MTEEGGSGARLVCPACGTGREAGGRFCRGCGLDYWRLAAGQSVEAATGSAGRRGRFSRLRRQGQPTSVPPVPPPSAAPAPPTESTTQPRVARGSAVSFRFPRSRRSRLLLGGLVVVVGVLLVAALVMRPATPAAVASTATPSPSPPGPDEVIGAFFKAVRDPAAAFEVKVTGVIAETVGSKRSSGSIAGDIHVAGDSWSGTLRLAQPGGTPFNGSIVRIGERSWTRASGGGWRSQPLPAGANAVNPFAWISTVDEVTYLKAGPEEGGRRTHVLETTKWLSGTDFDEIVLTLNDSQRDSLMEVVTTDTGEPLSASYRFSIRGTLSSGAGTLVLTGTTYFTFGGWGETVTIGPPQ